MSEDQPIGATTDAEMLASAVAAAPPPDPYAILGYIALEKAFQYLQDGVFSKWQSAVSPQLAEIARTLSVIAQKINEIVPQVQQSILANTIAIFKSEIESRRGIVERIAQRTRDGDPLTPADYAEVMRHKSEIEVKIGQLLQHTEFGFAGYHGVVSGVSTMMLAFKLTRTDRAEVKSYLRDPILPYLNSALDSSLSYSLVSGRSKKASAAQAALERFYSIVNRRWRVAYSQISNPDDDKGKHKIRAWRICTYSGDLDQPNISIATEDHDYGNSWPTEPWMPDLPEQYDMGDQDKGRERGWDVARDRLAAAQASLEPVRILDNLISDVQACRERLRAQLGG
jgi:hypothetical protein